MLGTSRPPSIATLPVGVPSELKARYLSLQQEADFALWRAREANAEARKAYAAHLAGQGPPPSEAELREIAALEQTAEARYRELRAFLREHFG